MIIAQMCLRLATIKGHSKMCSFTVLGGGGLWGSEKQSVSGVPWCSILSSFQNSLKTSGHRGHEFLEFCCWNFVPFLPDVGFQLLKSLWSSLMYFSCNDASNVLYR